MSASSKTVDHDEIRKWAEARGGRPSIVRTGSGKGKNKGGGVLRIDFGPKEEKFEEISWEEFFEVFDRSHISFLHQDETKDGKASRFSKFVERTGEEDKAAGKQGGAKQFGTAKKAAPTKPAGSKSDSAKSAAAKSSEAKPSPKKSAAKSASAKTGSTAKSPGKAESKTEAKVSASKGGAGKTTSKAGQKTSGTKANGGTKIAKKKG